MPEPTTELVSRWVFGPTQRPADHHGTGSVVVVRNESRSINGGHQPKLTPWANGSVPE